MPSKKLVPSKKLIGAKKATRRATQPHVRVVKDTRARNSQGHVRLKNGLIEYDTGERESVVLWEDKGGRVFIKTPDDRYMYVTEAIVLTARPREYITAGHQKAQVYRPIDRKLSDMDGVRRQIVRLDDPKRFAGDLHRYVVYGWNRSSNSLERRGTYEFSRGVMSAAERYYNSEPYGHFVVELEVR